MPDHVEWSLLGAYEIPRPTRVTGKEIVLSTLRGLWDTVPADQEVGQAARWLSLMLWGTVDDGMLTRAGEAWVLHHRITNGEDLVALLDMQNTDTARAVAANEAEGNMLALVDFILDHAGVTK